MLHQAFPYPHSIVSRRTEDEETRGIFSVDIKNHLEMLVPNVFEKNKVKTQC